RTLAERRANWRGDGYARAWERTLERHVFPVLGPMRVDAIRGDDVLRVLFQDDLWNRRPTTASRVRQQVRTVLGWAQAREFVERNVAGEAIDGALPKRRRRARSHRAVPHTGVRELLANVEESRSGAAVRLCLRFLILTAARSGEARGARWSEIDLDRRTWTLPGERMKAGKEHRVPLSPQVLAVLERARQLRSRKGCDLVFPGRSGDRELKDMALTNALWVAGVGERATVHGFRSTFSDWSAERGNAPMLAEAALAHVVQGVEGAYRRTDLFDERRPVMDAWGEYVGA
ncbi:MAG: site-specific integrase, partial [Chloroflexi bacterium]|nr:site-specific integrase [Chloroflexota bacterium]